MIVVAYDVKTDSSAGERRLRNVAKICTKYGQRVQNSVFECLVTPADFVNLKHSLEECMDVKHDNLRLYHLGSRYENKIEHIGVQRHLPNDEVMMV